MPDFPKFIVVGAGITGCVFAERIASLLHENVLVVEQRPKIGGNSSASIDRESGIEIHDYGSHIFHTKNLKVWRYMQQFAAFNNYRHHVFFTASDGRIYQMPVNLKTIQDFTGEMMSPEEAEQWLLSQKSGISNCSNMEEKAISLIGKSLYETFIKGYSTKQWGCTPDKIPASVITRLPVRTNFNTEYFDDMYQGIPLYGYQAMFEKMLSSPKISITLNTDFSDIRKNLSADNFIIYTGMIDRFFDYSFGELEWRSLRFEFETLAKTDFQGTSVMNYGSVDVPYTRIHEFKHYHYEREDLIKQKKTIICREYPGRWKRGMDAFYPVNSSRNSNLFNAYAELANQTKNVLFCGRLASYKYWDMDMAVLNALERFNRLFLEKKHKI